MRLDWAMSVIEGRGELMDLAEKAGDRTSRSSTPGSTRITSMDGLRNFLKSGQQQPPPRKASKVERDI